MTSKTLLQFLFSAILLVMIGYTGWASTQQPVLQWGGLTTGSDRYWTVATLLDAYFGFLTFYAWVFYKELRWTRRAIWFVAIMLLGNMAMAVYVLIQLSRLRSGQTPSAMLTARNS